MPTFQAVYKFYNKSKLTCQIKINFIDKGKLKMNEFTKKFLKKRKRRIAFFKISKIFWKDERFYINNISDAYWIGFKYFEIRILKRWF